jgi:hypothetical protein
MSIGSGAIRKPKTIEGMIGGTAQAASTRGVKNWNPSLRENFLSSLHLFWDLHLVLSITDTQCQY